MLDLHDHIRGMTSQRFVWALVRSLSVLTHVSCGGEVVRVPAPAAESDPDGGDGLGVDVNAPASESGARAASRDCPAGLVLQGDVCAGFLRAGSASCDTTTLLHDGRVLCAGGEDTRVYDPRTDEWGKVMGLHTRRSSHTATLLADGRVLVAGGSGANGTILASAEIFSPGDDAWHDATPMTQPRAFHAAALLRDGRVLVMGGSRGADLVEGLSSTEIFDPIVGTWTQAADLSGARIKPSASRMLDGTVLVFGGGRRLPSQSGLLYDSTAELYDPMVFAFRAAPSLPGALLLLGFSNSATTILLDGSVLGIGVPGVDTGTALLDSARTTWRTIEGEGAPPEPIASLLPNGSVLVLGTNLYEGGPSRASIYDPTHGTWIPTARPSGWYLGGTATQLLDGSVLVVSGPHLTEESSIAERYVSRRPIP